MLPYYIQRRVGRLEALVGAEKRMALLAADHRGVPRPLGVACDLGAFERWGQLFLPLMRR